MLAHCTGTLTPPSLDVAHWRAFFATLLDPARAAPRLLTPATPAAVRNRLLSTSFLHGAAVRPPSFKDLLPPRRPTSLANPHGDVLALLNRDPGPGGGRIRIRAGAGAILGHQHLLLPLGPGVDLVGVECLGLAGYAGVLRY